MNSLAAAPYLDLNMALRASSSCSSSVHRMWLPLYLSPLRVFRSVPQSFLHSASGSPSKPRVSKAKTRVESVSEVTVGSGGKIVQAELHKEATDAYVSYAMSVMLGRSLPDIRDGLKPVHRRILFAMHELGISSRKPYKKCARVVGEVLGKFHPHGDTAVYDSLVRMAQDFSLRCPLIQGHGNFGSLDADPPAAMRYTECRLQALTETMLLADLEEDTVDFAHNFDNSQQEPVVLPARIPSLLLNGSSGIAVGMATNIPPHNLGELVDALSALIRNPDATLQELLEHIPGPDFPTGGLIMGNSGISDTYETGRGRIIVRGKTTIEVLDSKSKQNAIVINEIPYQTNQASLVQKIAELVENKSLEGISDIRDESDRDGMRIVVELKRGSVPSIVLNNLFRMTSLQSSFSCNMVGIINGQPRQMGLKELLQAFLEFRCSVIERRAKFKLSQAETRRHVVEGIIVGLDNLDGVLTIIKNSYTNAAASSSLSSEYNLSEKQTEALLGMRLGNLTHIEKKKYVDEGESLTQQISKLQELLSSKSKILQVIERESNDLKVRFSTSRRTLLEFEDSGQVEEIDVIPNDEWILALSEKGYIKRMNPNNFYVQHRGTLGKSVGKLKVDDTMSDFLVCHAHDRVLFFSGKGIVHSTMAYRIPACTRTSSGTPLVQILSLPIGEKITCIMPVSKFSVDQYLVMLTLNGYMKKAPLDYFSSIRPSGIIAIQLVPNDMLKWVRICTDSDIITLASQNGKILLSSCMNIRTLCRNTRGSIAMKLREGDQMACMDIVKESPWTDFEKNMNDRPKMERLSEGPFLLLVSENGRGKRVPLSCFNFVPLNRVGLIGYKLSENDRLAAVFVVGAGSEESGGEKSEEQLLIVSQNGAVNRIKVEDVSIQSRYGGGVILMRVGYDDKIQSVSLVSQSPPPLTSHEEEEEEEVQREAPLLQLP